MSNNSYITEIKTTARIIHDFIYNNIKLSDQEHATFIAGALIALQEPIFNSAYKNDYCHQADYFVEMMMSAIKSSIYRCKGFDKPEKREIVLAEFSFIARNEQLKKIVNVEGHDWIAVQYLLKVLESVYTIAREHPEYDIFGYLEQLYTDKVHGVTTYQYHPS